MPDPQPFERDARFVGTAIPEIYDRHLVPFLFSAYAADLAGRVVLPGDHAARVLEVAAGTGVLTEKLLGRLPYGATLVATDLNEPMLALARRRAAAANPAATIEWRNADACSLPFGDGEFDAVACQLGVMFFPDKPRAAREAFRVLRPGGQWLFNAMASIEENPLGRVVTETIAGFFPADPPPFFRMPFSYHDERAMRALAADAGFDDVQVVSMDHASEAESAEHAAIGMVRGNPGVTAIQERGGNVDEIVAAVAGALAREFGDRPLRVPTRIRIMQARRPW